jgi:hypothetical protein
MIWLILWTTLAIIGAPFFLRLVWAWFSGSAVATATACAFGAIAGLSATAPPGMLISDYPSGVWLDTLMVVVMCSMPWLCRKAGV